MKSLWFLIFLCASAVFGAPAAEEKFHDGRGVVEGVQDCGSRGSVYQVRVDGCSRTPCQLKPDNIYEIEVDFSTSSSGEHWRVVVTASTGSTSVIVLDETVEAPIEPDERHTLHYELPVTTMFEGLDIQVKIQLFEEENQVEEVCISADAYVNEAPPTIQK